MDSDEWNGLCDKCEHTSCCNNFVTPFLTPKEKEKIENFVHTDFADSLKLQGMDVFALKKKPGTNECVFWKKDTGCGIYENRPFDCMLFPFDIYKIDNEFTWVVYACNPEADWSWSEKILQSLEEEIISEDVIKYIDAYSDLGRIEETDNSYSFVKLRKVNLKRFKQKDSQIIHERTINSSR